MISSKQATATVSKFHVGDTNGRQVHPGKSWTANDSIGLLAAAAILVGWATSLVLLLLAPMTDIFWYWAIPAILLQTTLHTGLFITVHEALHGNVTPNRRKLNTVLGNVAVFLYALFNSKKLASKHWEHHMHPGDPVRDPDFNDGISDRFDRWYVQFMMNYLSLPQLIGIAVVYNTMIHLLDVSALKLTLFWVTPAILSTMQLFLFGTYLPHKTPKTGHSNPHHSTSNSFPVWLSFLSCFHFGYHLEHHEYPRVPWWRLPAVRQKRVDPGPPFVLPKDPTSPSLS